MSDARKTVGAGGSSSSAVLPETFFQSDNLLRVLAAVRGAGIPDAERTAIRDAVLAYAQADESEKATARATLETVIAPHHAMLTTHVTDTAPQRSDQPARPSTPQIGTTRPQPRFAALKQQNPQPKVPPPPPKPAPTEIIPPKEEVPRAVSVKPQPAPEPKPSPEPEPVPPASTSRDAKTRIAEIKHAVNERIGNPVNLIEKDQAVGKEYMSALLDAIKRTSVPGSGTDAAMERLEKAFIAVKPLLDTPEASAPSKPEPKPAPKPEPEPASPAPPLKPLSSIPIESEAKPFADIARRAAVTTPAQPTEQKKMRPAPVAPPRPPAEPKAAEAPAEAKPEDKPTVSIAAMRAKTKPDAERGDGLKTPEVTAGLEQLLSEWTLFKSSGLFGTGPNGINHPLYKKLANLPMAAVIAGRFEGSKPEIKQNIADYMNGWRYEQGIVHRMDEQFEHYLRRVIRHILSKQPKTENTQAAVPKK